MAKRKYWIAHYRPDTDEDIKSGLEDIGVPAPEETLSSFIRTAMRNEIMRRKGLSHSPAPASIQPSFEGLKAERRELTDEELEKNLMGW